MEKLKRQFRLFDIYRQAYTGTSSSIRGISYYVVYRYENYSEIFVKYSNNEEDSFIVDKNNEDELRKVIKKVNKKLKNCRKPGKKRRKYNVAQ